MSRACVPFILAFAFDARFSPSVCAVLRFIINHKAKPFLKETLALRDLEPVIDSEGVGLVLHHLSLNPDTINKRLEKTPTRLADGSMERLGLKIPWNVFDKGIRVSVSGLKIHLVPGEQGARHIA